MDEKYGCDMRMKESQWAEGGWMDGLRPKSTYKRIEIFGIIDSWKGK